MKSIPLARFNLMSPHLLLGGTQSAPCLLSAVVCSQAKSVEVPKTRETSCHLSSIAVFSDNLFCKGI